jgi:hypothetical protein
MADLFGEWGRPRERATGDPVLGVVDLLAFQSAPSREGDCPPTRRAIQGCSFNPRPRERGDQNVSREKLS